MKSSILRWSLGGTQSSALNRPEAVSPRGTWGAIFTGKSVTSNAWIARTPDSPRVRRSQLFFTPTPSGVTSPMPVTTTRFKRSSPYEPGTREAAREARRSTGRVLVDEIDGVLDGENLFRSVVGDFASELLFERHHEFDG